VTALELVFDSNGSLETIASWPQETQSARTCLAHALADTRLDESPRASVTLRIDLSTATPSVVDADGPSTPPPTPAATEEPSADAPQPRDSGDDDAVRAALDARVTDILDCAGADRAVVRVAWESAQPPTVSLEGDLAGSPNEGCVRAMLRDALPELQATSGVVVHLVSR
jgi:hypothetical protein